MRHQIAIFGHLDQKLPALWLALLVVLLLPGCGGDRQAADSSGTFSNVATSLDVGVDSNSDQPESSEETATVESVPSLRSDRSPSTAAKAHSSKSLRLALDNDVNGERALDVPVDDELEADKGAADELALEGHISEDEPDAGSNLMTEANSPGDQVDNEADSQLLLGNNVEIFFATDRLPTAEVIPGLIRTFLPALFVLFVCCLLFIGTSAARRLQSLWILGCGLSVCLGVVVLHSCIIRWQQYSRLAHDAGTRFSTTRYESTKAEYPLFVGTAKISLPENHREGRIESPSLLKLEFVENPEKHIVIHSLSVNEDVGDWFRCISDQVKYAAEREGFIFIHGYNVRFSAALKRTAQLAVDLGVKGPVISYSWPSKGQIAGYSADEATVSWSAPHFERLLVDLRSRTECRTFNIVAHSMGNRALLESIERINLRMGSNQEYVTRPRMINNLVLAAPDIDAGKFESRYIDAINNVADRTTIYFSEQDLALQLSQGLHASPRLGINAGRLASLPGLEAIHIGRKGLFSTGHAYYGSDRVVLDDIRRLLQDESHAVDRPYLTQVSDSDGNTYWRLDRQLHALLRKEPNR